MKRHRRSSRISDPVAGLIALVVVAVCVYLGFTKAIPFQSHYEIKAAFRTSNNIRVGSPVRIAGVTVGKVVRTEPVGPKASGAYVVMRINENGRPLHSDARFKIRPRIFLEGNFFVEVSPGTPGSPELGDGDIVRATQTATPVQFDQVLRALDANTRQNLRITLDELAKAYDSGLAEAINGSLDDQAPAYEFTSIVNEALLGRRPHDLSDFIRDFGATAAAVDENPAQLKSLITDFNRTAAAIASRQNDLRETVGELPRTLAASNPALDALNASFPAVRRLAEEARPGIRSSRPMIAALRPLVAQLRGLTAQSELRGLSRSLRAATPNLVTLAGSTPPVLRQLRRLSACTVETLVPWSDQTVPDDAFPATGPVFQEAVKWLPGIGGESRSFDANNQWFKVLGGGGAETFQLGEGLFGTALFPILGTNPPKQDARPPIRYDQPCEDQDEPNLDTNPGAPPQRVNIDRNAPAVKAREAKALEVMQLQMTDDLRRAGLGQKILDRDATLADIRAIAESAGNLAQLERVMKRSAAK